MIETQGGVNKIGIGWLGLFGTILLTAVGFIIASALVLLLLRSLDPEGINAIMEGGSTGGTPLSLIGLLSSFLGGILGLWIGVGLILRRPLWVVTWSTLSDVWSGFWKYALGYGVIIIAFGLIAVAFGSVVPNTPLNVWLLWAGPVLLLILIQVSAEELLFRGFIQRVLYDWTTNRLVWMVIPSLAFGLLHYQPSIMGPNAPLLIIATFVFGLLAAELTYRTGSIGPAIGIHLMNNANAFLFIELDSGIGGMGLFKTTFSVTDVETLRASLLQGIGFYVVLFALVWFFVPKRAD